MGWGLSVPDNLAATSSVEDLFMAVQWHIDDLSGGTPAGTTRSI